MTKICIKCHQEKSIENDFGRRSASKDGKHLYCKECISRIADNNKEYREQWRKNNIDRVIKLNKNARLNRIYGITLEQFNMMLNIQQNRCSICNVNFDNNIKNIHVDHDHITGEVRELLCSRCNVAIGLLKEDTSILSNATFYLNKWK